MTPTRFGHRVQESLKLNCMVETHEMKSLSKGRTSEKQQQIEKNWWYSRIWELICWMSFSVYLRQLLVIALSGSSVCVKFLIEYSFLQSYYFSSFLFIFSIFPPSMFSMQYKIYHILFKVYQILLPKKTIERWHL